MNENDAYIFDVEEPREWVFDGKPVWISGWFLSKTGAVFSDIRAVIDDIPYLGLLGLPHEHAERTHRGYVGLPHAGFVLQVKPPPGAKVLRLELLDAGNHWVEIFRAPIKVKAGPRSGTKLRTNLVAIQLERLLQEMRARPGQDLSGVAEGLAMEIGAKTLDTLPNPPFFGALENPLGYSGSQFGKKWIVGWILHREKRIVRLLASTHPLVENELDYGDRPRGEATAMFPDAPNAAFPQFFGMADLDEHAPDPVVVKIFAELEDGSRHLVFARRFLQRSCNRLERPLPPYRASTFFAAVQLFVTACRRRRIRLGSLTEFWRQCRLARDNFRRDAPSPLALEQAARGHEDPYAAWVRTNTLTPPLRRILEQAAADLRTGPRFAVLVDARDSTPAQREDLARSLESQLYPHWEAWFVGAAAPRSGDPRFKTEPIAGPEDVVRALNAAAHQSAASHLTLLPGHSRLPSDALLEVAGRIDRNPDLELVYTDEDRMDDEGRRSDPVFKPAWSPALALSGLYPGLLSVVRRDTFLARGSFRPGTEHVPWFDLLLRLGDTLENAQVAHIPLVCHHARASVPATIDLAHPSVEQARLALVDTMSRRAWSAAPFLPETAHHRRLRYHQLRWDRTILSRLQVTIVIPTRDRLHLLQECVELLDETVDWRYVKLLIVDDHSRDTDAVRYLEAIQRRNDLLCTVVRPTDRSAPFNYSHLVNLALPHLDTPLVLHLNNDVNALERGWLEEMVGWFTQPDVGVVGAKLVYPDKTLNHTGIVIGPHGGLADTPYAKVAEQAVPDVVWHSAAREVSAVTGACLLTRTDLYRQLGGFDERELGVAFNDVDYCLRVRAAGRRVIYTPQAKLMHWGSATRGVTFDEAEHIAFLRRYPSYADRYLNPQVQLEGGAVRCRGAHHARPERAGRLRLLLLTHNLNLEGAPLFLLEYATYMAREAGFDVQVLASRDGPLRSSYEALGAPITVIDSEPIFSAETEEAFHTAVAAVGQRIDWNGVDLVVCNTLVSFWGVHLARRAGKPSVFYIHESTSLFRFFENMMRLHLHPLVHAAFHTVTRAFFLCPATRAYYEDDNLHGNFRLVPSWIQLDAIEAFRRSHTRAELRRKHGFADDEVVIANIGTVCERKGQHTFIRAIDHFNHHHGARAKFRFVLVGARPGIFLDLLNRDIARLGLKNLTLIPETREVFDFFVLADMFVCTSYEESFPRVVMEAMAFRTPIVSTDTHGIVDLIGQRQDGYLVKPGEVEGLSRMMWTCLAKERSGKSLAPTAYSKVLRYYDYAKVLPHHVALAQEAVLAGG